MDLNIELNEQEAQPVLCIRAKTPFDELPILIGESYRKIAEYMAELGEPPACAPYTAYYNLDMLDLDVEMGFPVAKPLPGKDDIKPGEVPAGKYVSCMYKGPYGMMEKTYVEIFRWMEEKGLEPAGAYYEYYYNAPNEVPDSELLTRISIPVK
ncbi:GyrI-like domain-containing protein [Pelotomaculum propionicicum]|uniref:GyrI-like domain-containing protein n=1 Tax=Pelotomaculum propionicicum TaxID=258475 RepID=UPI003B78B953